MEVSEEKMDMKEGKEGGNEGKTKDIGWKERWRNGNERRDKRKGRGKG